MLVEPLARTALSDPSRAVPRTPLRWLLVALAAAGLLVPSAALASSSQQSPGPAPLHIASLSPSSGTGGSCC